MLKKAHVFPRIQMNVSNICCHWRVKSWNVKFMWFFLLFIGRNGCIDVGNGAKTIKNSGFVYGGDFLQFQSIVHTLKENSLEWICRILQSWPNGRFDLNFQCSKIEEKSPIERSRRKTTKESAMNVGHFLYEVRNQWCFYGCR